MEVSVEKILLRVHDFSGSVITANSRRLRTLRNDPDALEQCRIDVKEGIIKFAHVSTVSTVSRLELTC